MPKRPGETLELPELPTLPTELETYIAGSGHTNWRTIIRMPGVEGAERHGVAWAGVPDMWTPWLDMADQGVLGLYILPPTVKRNLPHLCILKMPENYLEGTAKYPGGIGAMFTRQDLRWPGLDLDLILPDRRTQRPTVTRPLVTALAPSASTTEGALILSRKYAELMEAEDKDFLELMARCGIKLSDLITATQGHAAGEKPILGPILDDFVCLAVDKLKPDWREGVTKESRAMIRDAWLLEGRPGYQTSNSRSAQSTIVWSLPERMWECCRRLMEAGWPPILPHWVTEYAYQVHGGHSTWCPSSTMHPFPSQNSGRRWNGKVMGSQCGLHLDHDPGSCAVWDARHMEDSWFDSWDRVTDELTAIPVPTPTVRDSMILEKARTIPIACIQNLGESPTYYVAKTREVSGKTQIVYTKCETGQPTTEELAQEGDFGDWPFPDTQAPGTTPEADTLPDGAPMEYNHVHAVGWTNDDEGYYYCRECEDAIEDCYCDANEDRNQADRDALIRAGEIHRGEITL